MKYSIFSFFSGCGILDLGFEKAGFDIKLVNEFSPAFIEAYQYARSQMGINPPEYGCVNIDVNEFKDIRADELQNYIDTEHCQGRFVGFIGGPPCPDFSIAGKQRGRNGDNGRLSQSYIDLILKFTPDFFLFENVKGLWKTARHRAFYDELKLSLVNKGYCLSDRLTNALEFGVPQDRDRILLIGIKKDAIKEEYIRENSTLVDFPWTKHAKYSLDDIRNITWPDETPFIPDSVLEKPDDIPEKLTVEYWFKNNNVENHPDGNRFFKPKAGLKRMLEIPEGDSNKKSYKRIHRWRYSPTVAYGNNEVHLHPYKARRLSVAEAMSLQSLPKDFCLPPKMTLTDCFKTIGNGVPFLMAKGIAKSLGEYLDNVLIEEEVEK